MQICIHGFITTALNKKAKNLFEDVLLSVVNKDFKN
jgi:hypothetical protein